jgi:hypothetical protein
MENFKSALWRLVRGLLAQVPTALAFIQGTGNPKLIALGVFINATFKFLRDTFPKAAWIAYIPL